MTCQKHPLRRSRCCFERDGNLNCVRSSTGLRKPAPEPCTLPDATAENDAAFRTMPHARPMMSLLGRFCPWSAVIVATAGQIGPFLPLGSGHWVHRGAIRAVFAPGGRSLGPPRGKLGRFCPWGAVVGSTAGQIGPFLPLEGGHWVHRGAIWGVIVFNPPHINKKPSQGVVTGI